MSKPELHDALARARLLALDVDGTLTDGAVTYVGEEELQRFCVRDGQGMVWLTRAGVELTWITGRGCRATERRAEELRVKELHVRSGPKAEVLAGVQERLGVTPDETIAMGDDLPDLGLAERAVLFCAPADARPEVRSRAGLVTEAAGGAGAVRELAEAILRAKGLFDAAVGGGLSG
jgi:3-deoxy-D-manno-octulosonate 8-phosphate phosphatase (KDO 8-P phosphatase)